MLLLIKFKMSLKSHEKAVPSIKRRRSPERREGARRRAQGRAGRPLRSPVQGTSARRLRARRAAQHRLPRGKGSIRSVTEGLRMRPCSPKAPGRREGRSGASLCVRPAAGRWGHPSVCEAREEVFRSTLSAWSLGSKCSLQTDEGPAQSHPSRPTTPPRHFCSRLKHCYQPVGI